MTDHTDMNSLIRSAIGHEALIDAARRDARDALGRLERAAVGSPEHAAAGQALDKALDRSRDLLSAEEDAAGMPGTSTAEARDPGPPGPPSMDDLIRESANRRTRGH